MGLNLEGIDIKKILLQGDYVTAEDIEKARDYAESHHVTLVDYLLSEGVITKTLVGQAVAEFYGLPFLDLGKYPPGKEMVLKIPSEIAKAEMVIAVKETAAEVVIATSRPVSKEIADRLGSFFKGQKLSFVFALPEDIMESYIHYRQTLEARFTKIITGQKKVAPEILQEIINDALLFRASDVHFEPGEEQVLTRFRVDGVLHEAGQFPKGFYENVLNRIKVQAGLRIDDHFSAQDGAIRFVLPIHGELKAAPEQNFKPGLGPNDEQTVIDARISIVPTLSGEKVVMRLLSEYLRSLNLSELGLSEENLAKITASAKKPFGMILSTGPTGSGKTTTLYALIKMLNQPDVNITTIEDPVEYRDFSINQIQVNPATGLTFAKGLRSIVRQDPDIILVGEIRDTETAEMAVNASLTGHLLLSTFHANDAASAIPRLLDMKVEPYLAASTLELIVAQRLLRRICGSCRYSTKVAFKNLAKILPGAEKYFLTPFATLYAGKGCVACNFTGYKGRVGIFELMPISKSLRELIVKNPTAEEVWMTAKKEGACSLFEDGIDKVKNGLSTLEELARVAPPSET